MATCTTCNKKKIIKMFDVDDEGTRHSQCKLCRPDLRTYTCNKCQKETPYNKMSFNRGNLQNKCGECCRQEARERYQKNRQKRIAKAKEYVGNNETKVKQYQKSYNRSHRAET